MNTKVNELMTASVLTAEPHHSVEHVRQILENNNISSLPIVNTAGEPIGIISATDLAHELKPGSKISKIMTEKVYVIPMYDDVSIAARIMRNHKIHHVVVTHEKKVVGILSAFDLLKLVESHRYIEKNPPTESKRKGSKRQ